MKVRIVGGSKNGRELEVARPLPRELYFQYPEHETVERYFRKTGQAVYVFEFDKERQTG